LRKQEELRKALEDEKKNWRSKRDQTIPTISEEEVAHIVSKWTGVPVTRLTATETDKLVRMEEELHKRLIGQETAIRAISQAIRRSRTGLKDPKKPIGSFLFLGPTGVGKTELARTLAETLFGNEDALFRLIQQKLGDSRLFTVCQWAWKKAQVTAICITATGRTMISSERPNSEVGSQRLIWRGI